MKKGLVVLSVIGLVIFVLFTFSREFGFCSTNSYSSCGVFFDGLGEALLPMFPLLLFSLVTYFMPEKIFKTWSRFALVWIPVSMIGIFLAPEYSGDWLYPVTKGSVAFLTSILFTIISSLIILFVFLFSKKKGEQSA